MYAIGVKRDTSGPQLLEIPRPEPAPGEALVRTLRVGVDGTDHEVLDGTHGGFPAEEEHLVLGHEAVGVVEEPNDTEFNRGDVVVPTVRRPPAGGNEYFERGEADMAPPEATLERGIDGAHGFMSEYFTSPAEYLIDVPDRLAEYGFLTEPVSISEKALELARQSRAGFSWVPETALVLGNGSLGLLTVAMLVEEMETYCLGRRDRSDPTVDVLDMLGATYVDGRETPVSEIPNRYEAPDLVYEATGYAEHALTGVQALAPNGVAALLGLPGPDERSVDLGAYHKDLVMHNKAVVGSVNSGPRHFRAAAETLDGLDATFLDALVTTLADYREFESAFATDASTIKAAVQFHEF
ncbi:alcohol dehydrogenase catalytic domain-containing protein [Halovenus sp. WSH3]|uniref:Glucose 1-dehydrogenase n=1 Tax=Halovenus carboxidivorans TaxID=2692199 RepID=A0A6B0TAK0_9EURY|nr:glucose 1-dehydrogenase [Halovenus carboxidivorans]MXR51910.1 alcohol dehydrogenase catalytic domain-containing protein [Halovenus carboxidivorans]